MRTDMKLRQQKPKEKVNTSQGRSSIVLHVVQLQHGHAVSYLLTVQKSICGLFLTIERYKLSAVSSSEVTRRENVARFKRRF